jgi:hypothetical protein
LSLLFLFSFDPLSRPLGLDPATWDYMSVEVSRGLIPYRDIFLHKTPLAALLGSTGALAASDGATLANIESQRVCATRDAVASRADESAPRALQP